MLSTAVFALTSPHMRSRDIIATVLKRVRKRIKLVDAGTGLFFLAAFLLLFLLVEVICDHTFALHKGTRLVFLSVLKLSALAIVAVVVLFPLLRRIRDVYAAKLIEDAYPDFKNSLTSLLQARNDPDTPPDALTALEQVSARQIAQIRPAAVVSTRRFTYAGYLLAVAMVLAFAYAVHAPRRTLCSFKRGVQPEKDIPPPTKTLILRVDPGKETPRVLRGSPVDVAVKIGGDPPQRVTVEWTTRSGERVGKALKKGEHRNWRGRIGDVGRGVEYFITAGDTKSEIFTIKTAPPPMAQRIETEWDDGQGRPGSTRKNVGGDIDAPKDTTVRVTAKINNRLKSATVVTDSGKEIPMTVAPDGREASAELTVVQNDRYHLALTDEYGHTNEDPPKYDIACREPEKLDEPVRLAKRNDRRPDEPEPEPLKQQDKKREPEPEPIAKPDKKKDDNAKPKAPKEKDSGGNENNKEQKPPAGGGDKKKQSTQTADKKQPADKGRTKLAKGTERDLLEQIKRDRDKIERLKKAMRQTESGRGKSNSQPDSAGAKEKATKDKRGKSAQSGSKKSGSQSASKKEDGTKTGQGRRSGGSKDAAKSGGKPKKQGPGSQSGKSAAGKTGSKSGSHVAKSGSGKSGSRGQKPGSGQSTGSKGQKTGPGKGAGKAGGQGGKKGGGSGQKTASAQGGGSKSAQSGSKGGQGAQSGGKGAQGQGSASGAGGPGSGQGSGSAQKTASAQGGGPKSGQSGSKVSPGGQSGQGRSSGQGGGTGSAPGSGGQPGSGGNASAAASGPGGVPGQGPGMGGDGGEDTLGQGQNIDEVITTIAKLCDRLQREEAVDDSILVAVGVGDEQGLKRFVKPYEAAIRARRRSLRTAGGGPIRLEPSSSGEIRRLAAGGKATAEIDRDKIRTQGDADQVRQIFIEARPKISHEYRDMVDDYFRTIAGSGAGNNPTPTKSQ